METIYPDDEYTFQACIEHCTSSGSFEQLDTWVNGKWQYDGKVDVMYRIWRSDYYAKATDETRLKVEAIFGHRDHEPPSEV